MKLSELKGLIRECLEEMNLQERNPIRIKRGDDQLARRERDNKYFKHGSKENTPLGQAMLKQDIQQQKYNKKVGDPNEGEVEKNKVYQGRFKPKSTYKKSGVGKKK